MSKQKVYNYVMNTPHNTNPNILGSLLDEPTSWNDLTDRPFYSEPGEVLPETTVEIDPKTRTGILPDMTIYAGDECTIKYNGTEYVCKCVDMGGGALALGNSGLLDEENPVDTGEPFALIKVDSGEGVLVWGVVPLDGSASVTLSVIGQVHHKVPDKYMPSRVVDVNFTVSALGNGEISYTPDMGFEEVLSYAHMPNTLVRGVVLIDNRVIIYNLSEAQGEYVMFTRMYISNMSGVNEDSITMYSDGRCEFKNAYRNIK